MVDSHWIRAHCGRMDHGGCGLLVQIEDGQIVQVKGDKDHPRSRGYICSKGVASPERLNHPDRLLNPLRRVGGRGEGRWESISWEEALASIAEKFNDVKSAYGARAVAFCHGAPRGLEFLLMFRLAHTFGSPNVVGISNVCHWPRAYSARMTMGFLPVVDYEHPAQCYLIWGSNIPATNEEGVLRPLLMDRVNEGRNLIVVDPRRTKLAQKADFWLQLRPGSDAALALGFMNVIIAEHLYDEQFVQDWTVGFDDLAQAVSAYTPDKVAELTWVKPDLIKEAARLFAQARPGAVQWGNAIEHSIHSFDTCRAISCLMAITGNLDVPGGNVQPNPPPVVPPPEFAHHHAIPNLDEESISSIHSIVPGFPRIPPAFFNRAVLFGEPYSVRAAYVQASNPVMAWESTPETIRALKSLDFLCVADLFMTPTAALADLVLPVASHFEFNDIGHYGLPHGYLLARPKLVDPPPLCWPDIKILNELAKHLGLENEWWEDSEDILDEVLSPAGITYAQLTESRILWGDKAFHKYKTKGFQTPSGKVELRSDAAASYGLSSVPVFAGFPEPDDSEFPLLLSSAKNPHYFHSAYRQLPGLRKRAPNPLLTVHPETAQMIDLEEGQPVQLETSCGQIILTAAISDAVHPKVVYADYGWYFPERPEAELFDCLRSNVNVLTSNERLGKAFGTPNLKAIPCRISKP